MTETIQPSVAIVRCPDYEIAKAEAAVRRAVDLLGGMGSVVRPGQRVLLKINLLRVAAPEAACTTHPAVVAAVVSQLALTVDIALDAGRDVTTTVANFFSFFANFRHSFSVNAPKLMIACAGFPGTGSGWCVKPTDTVSAPLTAHTPTDSKPSSTV